MDLGFFKEEVLDKLDVVFNYVDSLFVYGNPEIKAHIIIEGGKLSIKLDTSVPMEEMVEMLDKYLEFP